MIRGAVADPVTAATVGLSMSFNMVATLSMDEETVQELVVGGIFLLVSLGALLASLQGGLRRKPEVCMVCQGTGGRKCFVCDGTGKEQRTPEEQEANPELGLTKPCRLCRGVGYMLCKRCKGTGYTNVARY